MILPVGASSFSEALRMGAEVYHNLKSGIKKKYGQAGALRRPCLNLTHFLLGGLLQCIISCITFGCEVVAGHVNRAATVCGNKLAMTQHSLMRVLLALC